MPQINNTDEYRALWNETPWDEDDDTVEDEIEARLMALSLCYKLKGSGYASHSPDECVRAILDITNLFQNTAIECQRRADSPCRLELDDQFLVSIEDYRR